MERKSRRLSYILRHHPESIGIKLDEHAYGDVQKTLEALNITIEDLDMIVREDEKQRYSYNGEPYVFTIDTKQMYEDGYKFYLSENNIYLTKIIPTKYLKAST